MIVIKIGGNLVSQLPDEFFQQIKQMLIQGQSVLIMHGGGNLITEASTFVGLQTQKIDGIRVTSPALMKITETVLAKIVQPALAQQFADHGIECQSLNQTQPSVFTGAYLDQAKYGEVGILKNINFKKLHNVALAAPIISGPQQQPLNVNADYAAINVASLTQATQCILMTDVPGVLIDGKIISTLNEKQAKQMIENGQLTGGMIPKVKAALQALQQGVSQINITNDLQQPGTVIKLTEKEH